MKDLLKIGIEAAKEAGNLLFENEGKARQITIKRDSSLVTDLDKRAEKIISDTIKSHFPTHGIIGEEGSAMPAAGDYRWIIDPLDGTHNYIRGIPLYGVAIGVVNKEEFVAGIIYLPHENSLYAAEKGSGTFKNSRRVVVSPKADLAHCTLSYDSCFRDDPGSVKVKGLSYFAHKVFNLRMLGSSAVILSFLAEGKIDCAIEFDDKLWDFAAGVSLITEAGGRFTDFNGTAATDSTNQYVASNGIIHDAALSELRKVLSVEKV
jgi:myo-inositol-1(or 4)-monophosphatase